jgi:cytochrome c oxidase subunit IV
VFAAALASAVVPFVLIASVASSIGQDEEAAERASSTALIVEIFALLLALVAGIAIVGARVASGYARWSLIVAVLLIAVTIILGYTNTALDWQDVPRAVGILSLGISYWRVGLRTADLLPE